MHNRFQCLPLLKCQSFYVLAKDFSDRHDLLSFAVRSLPTASKNLLNLLLPNGFLCSFRAERAATIDGDYEGLRSAILNCCRNSKGNAGLLIEVHVDVLIKF